jgi:hypothetical protein
LKITKKKILIVGNSNKFIKFINKNFNYEFLKIVAWRNIMLQINYSETNNYDLILICGFDFNSFDENFNIFFKKNITYPLNFILKNLNTKTDVLYIDTLENDVNTTFSRYKFAKKKLSYLLTRKIKNIYIYNSPLILRDGSIDLNKGWFTKIILPFFIMFKIIPSIDFKKMSFFLKNYRINLRKKKLYSQIYGKNLYFKRNQFLDRTLRILFK